MDDFEMTEGSAMQSDTNHIRRIDLDGLFRQYDHRIELQQEDRVTILHGRNGVGKTITLSLVAALLEGRPSKLSGVPFKKLRIEFTDGAFVEARPGFDSEGGIGKGAKKTRNARLVHGRTPVIQLQYAQPGREPKSCEIRDTLSQEASVIAQDVPWLLQVDKDKWYDQRTGEHVFAEDLVRRYRDPSVKTLYEPSDEAKEAQSICKRVPVHFIEAQRLFKIGEQPNYRTSSSPITSAVKDISLDMARRIKETDSTYRSTSTQLDDSLPSRLFTTTPIEEAISPDELDKRSRLREGERSRLRDIGLLGDSKTAFNPRTLEPTKQAMFVVYLDDNEKKLAVFKDLADRAEILLDILNSKFHPKRVQLDKDEGYRIFSHDNQPLKPDWLSSGEQHEMVLLHNLLFRVKPGSLLLIDEPELSLHVTWQNEFLADLIRVAKKVGFDAIVATHSPYIVGSRRDLMVRLGEPV